MEISIKDFEDANYLFYKARQCGKSRYNINILKAYLEAKEKGLDSFKLPEVKFIEMRVHW